MHEATHPAYAQSLLIFPLAMNASGSQRSSLTTSGSIFSRDSRISTDSYAASAQASQYAGYRTQPAETDYHGHAINSLPQTFQDVHDSPHNNQASPYAQTAQFAPEKHYCLTCQKCYTDQVGLKKHRKEQCERSRYWLCLHCLRSQTQRWVVFRREYRLHEHHRKDHGGRADLDMDEVTKKYPTQQAWGCPCCQACFSSRTEWHRHEKQHAEAVHWVGKNGDAIVNGWSWETLFRSLLLGSSFLKEAASFYDWKNCNWRQGPATSKELQFVLEKYELPPDVARHHGVSPMRTAQDLVSYAHQVLSTGSCNFQQLPSSTTHNTAISPILSNFPSTISRSEGTGHHLPSANGYSIGHEHYTNHDANRPGIYFDATIQTSTPQACRWPSTTVSHSSYNPGLQQTKLHMPAYTTAHSGILTQSCHLPSSHEPRKLSKWSLLTLRGSHPSSREQVSSAPGSIIPLADLQAAAEREALTRQHIFAEMTSESIPQDEATDFPMATQSPGNSCTWLDAYFDPAEGGQQGQY